MILPGSLFEFSGVFALIWLLLTLSGMAIADDAPEPLPLDSRRTIGQFPVNVGRGWVGLFSRENVKPFLWGAAAIGISYLIEDDVRDKVMDDNDDASEFASDYLGPLGLGVVTAGVFVAGQYSDDLVFRDMSYDMGVAVVANLVLTGVLKEGVSRTRPNEGDDQSFPSGHTSNAFAIAAVADAHYGRKAGIPAYVVASLIGVSRVRRDAHWLSDVVAGAALGYLTGTTVVRQNSKTDRKLTFLPSLSPSFQGLVVQGEF